MRKTTQTKLPLPAANRTHSYNGGTGYLRALHSRLDAHQNRDRARRDGRSGPDTSNWEIKDFLTFRINILYRLLDRQLKKMLADHHHLSIAEWRVLGQLATNSPTTVRAVAATTYMAKSQISRAAASLVRSGHAVRGKDVDDDRSAVFAITKEGLRKYKTVMRMNRERQRRLLAQLEPAECRIVFEAISRLIGYVRGQL